MSDAAATTSREVPHEETIRKEEKGKAPLLSAPASSVEIEKQKHIGGGGGGGGYKRGLAIFDLVLRLCAIVAALAATATMATTQQTLPFFTQFFQFQASYDDLPTFQFFVVAMAIVSGYLVLSIPFSVVTIIRPHASGPKLLLIILDTVALVLTTGAGSSAAAIVYLAHNGNTNANWLGICQQFGDFCQRASGAVVASSIAVALMIVLVVLSAVALRRR